MNAPPQAGVLIWHFVSLIMAASGPKPRPVIERLLARAPLPPGCIDPKAPCWQWTGAKTRGGYGKISAGSETDGTKRMALAHRVAYEHFIGPVPEGLELDHVCHNGTGCPGGLACRHRACVNPWHLEAVTGQVNRQRGEGGAREAARTHCPQGHAYDETNTYHPPGKPRRICRACNRAAKARAQKNKLVQVWA